MERGCFSFPSSVIHLKAVCENSWPLEKRLSWDGKGKVVGLDWQGIEAWKLGGAALGEGKGKGVVLSGGRTACPANVGCCRVLPGSDVPYSLPLEPPQGPASPSSILGMLVV